MAFWLSQGALLECTMGLAPTPLNVLPLNRVVADFMPVACILDNKPFLNIVPFGMCKSPANPAVAAIIASSLGSVTQGPCIPETLAPWTPAAALVSLTLGPAIDNATSVLMCNWLGVIKPSLSGQRCTLLV